MYRGTHSEQSVTGVRSISPNVHARRHTVQVEKVGIVTGLVSVTARGHGMGNAQSLDNNQIDLNAPKLFIFEGSVAEILLTPTVGTDVYSYSISSTD